MPWCTKRLSQVPGMVFTIEPMLCEGSASCSVLGSDGWTVVTKDGRRAAQYEHTVVITQDDCEVLTRGSASTLPANQRRWKGYLQ